MPALASLLVLAVGPAGLTTPPVAGNCYGPNYVLSECVGRDYIQYIGLEDEPVPAGGVLRLWVIGGDGPDLASLVTATVTHNGLPVPGALESSPVPLWIAWRPQDPLTPGAIYEIHATGTNPADVAHCPDGYGYGYFEFSGQFTASAEPAVPLADLAPTAVETLRETNIVDLEHLACCPGVAPTAISDRCGGYRYEFDPDECTSVALRGSLNVKISGPSPLPGQQVGYALEYAVGLPRLGNRALDFSVNQGGAFCATLTAHDLAYRTTLTRELCFGADLADRLGGPHPVDPPADFPCEPRQCAANFISWDLETCDANGCGCTTTSPPSLLLLTPLLLLRRRRLSRSATTASRPCPTCVQTEWAARRAASR